MSVRAKVVCESKVLSSYRKNDGSTVVGAQLSFRAVYPDWNSEQNCCDFTKMPENKIFGDATPSLSLQTYIVNDKAHEQFEPGKEYYLDFVSVEVEQEAKNAMHRAVYGTERPLPNLSEPQS